MKIMDDLDYVQLYAERLKKTIDCFFSRKNLLKVNCAAVQTSLEKDLELKRNLKERQGNILKVLD